MYFILSLTAGYLNALPFLAFTNVQEIFLHNIFELLQGDMRYVISTCTFTISKWLPKLALPVLHSYNLCRNP